MKHTSVYNFLKQQSIHEIIKLKTLNVCKIQINK